ncbi:hypothetical protein AMECASPLE_001148 [Ameca splendens]|uniref:Uncharacterized protein n=1 Tax=Ameca splendens TaxID=208324 RepID=A0ABV0XLZ9_9TELE
MRPGITLKLAGWAKPVSSHGSTVTRQRHGLNDGEPGGGLSLETIAEIKTPDRGRLGSVAFCAAAILKTSTSFFPFVETHCGILIGVDKSASLLYLPPSSASSSSSSFSPALHRTRKSSRCASLSGW